MASARDAVKRRDGVYTSDEIAKILEWLEAKGVSNACSVCGEESLTLNDDIASIPLAPIGQRSYPCFALFCGNCGHYDLFNALAAKVLEPDDSDSGSED